ncbi:MAG: glycosyltransferase [Candidatus Micrarchaeaceae archaeon]
MRIAVVSTIETKTPPLIYGGVELLAYELWLAAKNMGHEARLFGVGRRDIVSDYDQLTSDYDLIVDLSHRKYFQAFPHTITIPFHPDPQGRFLNAYPTKVTMSLYKGPGKVVYPGISPVEKKFDIGEDYLLFVGRLTPYKDPLTAIRVARKLDMPLVIVAYKGKFADKAYVDMIEREVKDEKILYGLSREEIMSMYYNARALLMPSDWSMLHSVESLGIVAMEALIAGCPVVTSGEGPIELANFGEQKMGELIGGYACKPKDIDCFVEGVKYSDKVDRRSLRVMAREFYNPARWLSDLMEMIQHD